MGECIFCKIALEKSPEKRIIDSENFFLIKDIDQRIKGHGLVIPKKHFENFIELESSLYREFLDVAKRGAKILCEEVGADGFNLVINNGRSAGQVIMHVHMHILPRREGDGLRVIT